MASWLAVLAMLGIACAVLCHAPCAARAAQGAAGSAGAGGASGGEKDPEKAKKLFQLGSVSYDLARYDEALAAFQQAYALDPRPAFHFNIGQCQRKLGRADDALVSFHRYLDGVPNAPNRDVVQQLIRELEGQRRAPSPPAPVALVPAAPTPSAPPPSESAEGATDGAATPMDARKDADAPAEREDDGADPLVIAAVAGGAAAVVLVGVAATVAIVSAATAPTLGTLDLREGS